MANNKRLTPDERERIVELRLNRVPVRTVATEVGCQTKTVQAVWKRWLDETSAERSASLERTREELVQRHERIATDARLGYLRARRDNDRAAEVRYLAEERNALREIARLTGADAPVQVAHTHVTLDALDAEISRLAAELEAAERTAR
jgi:transposase-like protein